MAAGVDRDADLLAGAGRDALAEDADDLGAPRCPITWVSEPVGSTTSIAQRHVAAELNNSGRNP